MLSPEEFPSERRVHRTPACHGCVGIGIVIPIAVLGPKQPALSGMPNQELRLSDEIGLSRIYG